jgi:hypothetical protein
VTRHTGPFKRVLLGALALFGAVQARPVSAEAGWKANADDAILLDVRLRQYRLGDGVRGYMTPGGMCLDMADMIMALDVPVRLDKKLRRATGWIFEERRSITLDREAGTVQIMNKSAPLAESDVYDAPEGWCVSSKKLAEWFGVGLDADLTNAVLNITSSSRLPVEMALERRSRAAKIRPVVQFDLASLPQARMPMKGFRAPSVDVVVSAGGFRQSKASGQQVNFSYELFAAGEAGPVAYDARLSANRAGTPESLRLRAYRVDPEGQMLGPLKATQIAAGDIAGYSTPLVSQSTAGRGAFITNRPLKQPASFDRTDFRGELPKGWDAELYRNGELLAFASDRADGRYEFLDIALNYGQNRFEVVLYGPQGQVKREERMVSVGADSIPPRQTWYWAGINQDGYDLIGLNSGVIRAKTGWRATAGFERGLDARTSVSAYGHSLMRVDGTRRHYGEVAVRRAFGPALAEFSAASSFDGGYALRGQMLGQLGRTNIQLESIIGMGGFQSDRLYSGTTGIHSIAVDQALMFGKSMVPLHADFTVRTLASGDQSREAALRSSLNLGRMSLTGQLDWRQQHNRTGSDPPGTTAASLLANARIGRVRFRSESRFRISPSARFDSLNLVGEWGGNDSGSGQRSNNWRAEIGYEAANRRLRGAIGYVRQFDRFSLTGTLGAGSDGSFAAGLNLAFSLGPDPTRPGHIRMTSDRLATNGQVMATIFRDLNGDGVRQSDEPGEPEVQLTAGRAPVDRLTNKKGEVILDNIQPFQALLIGVDGSSLPDPMVQPVGPGKVVHPRPGIAMKIELPLVSAGEVDGTLVDDAGKSLEGIELELVDAAGVVLLRSKTEFDGFFLFESVPYGQYEIRVARASAEAVRIQPRLAALAHVGGATPIARLGTIKAEPWVRSAQGP